MTSAEPTLKNKVVTTVQEPPLFRVIYLNDNVTTVDFVIDSLITVFDYELNAASQVTMEIHEAGSAIVAVLPYEMAEQKTTEALLYAKANKFPLQVIKEPDA